MIERIRKSMLLSLFAVVVFSHVPGYSQVTTTGRGARAIEGSWMTTTVMTNCEGQVVQTFPKLIAFHMGGTANEASASNTGYLRTTSFGGWKYIGENLFRYELRALRFNPDTTYAGPFRATYGLTYDREADTYAAEGVAQVMLPNGTVVATFCITEKGTRLVVSD